MVYRDYHINVFADMNFSSKHIRSRRLNSSCTINYSNLSGVAIIGHRDGDGLGGLLSLRVPQKPLLHLQVLEV